MYSLKFEILEEILRAVLEHGPYFITIFCKLSENCKSASAIFYLNYILPSCANVQSFVMNYGLGWVGLGLNTI